MKVAFQMEDMAETVRDETHSLVMMEEACARGLSVFHYHPSSVSLDNGGVTARAAPVRVDLSQEDFYTLGDYAAVDLTAFDIVFFRQDPPFDMGYVTNTFILERLRAAGVLLVNDPFWIRNTPDKLSIFDFPDFLPPTLVSRERDKIKGFFAAHKNIVIKPLYGFHGHGIIHTASLEDAWRMMEEHKEPLMFQPFLPAIREGNKRIVFFDGEIAGALKSMPQDDSEFRVYRNSVDVPYEPDARDLELCARLGPMLKERGLLFVGIDLIGPYLVELNSGSVGSLRRLNRVYNEKSEARLWDAILSKVKT